MILNKRISLNNLKITLRNEECSRNPKISNGISAGISYKCDSSYPDVCITPYPPDLNCDDIPNKNFEVLPPDPHGFDREEDGIGCEN